MLLLLSALSELIAIRIAPKLLSQLRRVAAKQSKPYQTLIHDLLKKAACRVARPRHRRLDPALVARS